MHRKQQVPLHCPQCPVQIPNACEDPSCSPDSVHSHEGPPRSAGGTTQMTHNRHSRLAENHGRMSAQHNILTWHMDRRTDSPAIHLCPITATHSPAVGPHRMPEANRMIVSLVSAGQFVANCSEGSFSKVCATHAKIREQSLRFYLKPCLKRLYATNAGTPKLHSWHSNRCSSANLLHGAVKLMSPPFRFAEDFAIPAGSR